MELRDEAKAGLAKMEAMGQMGNSEEATLPDEMPFSLEDLDMEDEDQPQEMAEGGYVMVEGKPMPIPMIGGQLAPITTRPMPETKNMAVGGFTNPTGTYQVPTNIATQPSYFQNYQQSTAPFQPFVPQTQVQPVVPPVGGAPQTFPSFATLMPTVGGKRETKEYQNEAGQKLFIPFIDGKPIYPIPEGYTLFTQETAPATQTTSQRSISQTISPQVYDDSDGNVKDPTVVRGIDGKLTSTNVRGQSPEQVSKTFSNLQNQDRAKSVVNALTQSKGLTGTAKTLNQLGFIAVNLAMPPSITAGRFALDAISQKKLSAANPIQGLIDEYNNIGNPDMRNRDAISSGMGYDINKFMDSSGPTSGGYIDDILAETRREQEAFNTAVLGGYNIGNGQATGLLNRDGQPVATVTKENVIDFLGQNFSINKNTGTIQIGNQPGEIDRNGVIYNAAGIGIASGNDPSSFKYSTPQAKKDFKEIASKIGWRGSYGLALELSGPNRRAPKAIAVVEAVKELNKLRATQRKAFQPMSDDTRTNDQVKADLAKAQKEAIDASEYTALPSVQPQYDTSGNDSDDNPGMGGGDSGDTSGYTDDSGVGVGARGGFFTKSKMTKQKPKKMKRGGLASR